VVLIPGEPGIGKSRIAQAIQDRLSAGAHTRLRYFCSPHSRKSYGLKIEFWQVRRNFPATVAASSSLMQCQGGHEILSPPQRDTQRLRLGDL
jgi:predicted ATPase